MTAFMTKTKNSLQNRINMETMKLFMGLLIMCVPLMGCSSDQLNDEDPDQLTFHRPFPQALDFKGCIRPNVDPQTMNQQVAAYYDYWKQKYLRPGVYIPDSYYIHGENTGGTDSDKGTSEGHGWGMIITALMAGHDEHAKEYFDGLLRMFNSTRSVNNPYLMAWLITDKEDAGGQRGSATDGDMDVAYGLLLAHRQWGSDGEFNYLEKAHQMIQKGIAASLIDSDSKRLMLGDWDQSPYTTRSSDWMAGHLRAYHHFTQNQTFLQAADTIYALIDHLTQTYAPATGLVPDFVIGNPAQPSGENFLETEYDGTYNWNACRFPMRIAADYAHHGHAKAKESLAALMSWLVASAQHHPENVRPGYFLDGTPIPGRPFESAAYTAPLIAAAITNADYQQWLDKGWQWMVTRKELYYPDTINLLCMLLISGNWWSPDEH